MPTSQVFPVTDPNKNTYCDQNFSDSCCQINNVNTKRINDEQDSFAKSSIISIVYLSLSSVVYFSIY